MSGILRVLLLLTASAVGGFFSPVSYAERVYSPKTLQGPVAPFSHLYGSGYASLDAALAAANTVSHNAGCYDWSITATFQPSAVGSYHAADMHTDSQGKSSCGTFTKPINAYAKMLCPDGYTADTTKADTDPQACWKDVEDPPPPSNNCSSLAGQTVTMTQQCGVATCDGAWIDVGDSIGCSGSSNITPSSPSVLTSIDSCAVSYTSIVTSTVYASPSIVGTNSLTPVLCEVTYTYTGDEAPSSNDNPGDSSSNQNPGTPINVGSGGDTGGGTGGDTGGGTGGDTGGGTGGDTGGGTGGDTGGGSGGDSGAPCVPTEGNPCEEQGTGTASGPCDTPPTCSGDALQCAILRQIWESSCEAQKIKPEVTQQAEDTLTQAEGEYQQKQSEIDAQVSGLSAGFASSLNVGAGACFPDQSISVMGKTVTIPYSDACEYFQYLRLLLILFAYYRAARVIYEAF